VGVMTIDTKEQKDTATYKLKITNRLDKVNRLVGTYMAQDSDIQDEFFNTIKNIREQENRKI